MTHTVAGLFENHRVADLVVEHLVQEYGVPRECVRVHAGDGLCCKVGGELRKRRGKAQIRPRSQTGWQQRWLEPACRPR